MTENPEALTSLRVLSLSPVWLTRMFWIRAPQPSAGSCDSPVDLGRIDRVWLSLPNRFCLFSKEIHFGQRGNAWKSSCRRLKVIATSADRRFSAWRPETPSMIADGQFAACLEVRTLDQHGVGWRYLTS